MRLGPIEHRPALWGELRSGLAQARRRTRFHSRSSAGQNQQNPHRRLTVSRPTRRIRGPRLTAVNLCRLFERFLDCRGPISEHQRQDYRAPETGDGGVEFERCCIQQVAESILARSKVSRALDSDGGEKQRGYKAKKS